VSTGCYRALRERGIPIVREQINTHALTYVRLQQQAYAALGWPMPAEAVPTETEIANEKEELALANFVFAPSELVAKSLREGGVDASRIIPASYGWSGQDVLPGPVGDSRAGQRPLTFMFAASGNVRKGLPWLLQAWKQADLSTAALHIYGSVEGIVAERCADLLALPNIKKFGYVRDLRARYSEADVFVLPSHEEGSPMVSYCAAAAGLAMVVSPMGSGGFLRPGVDAMVLDPFDVNAWAQAFHLLHDDAQLRRGYQDNASLRAREFTWQAIAQRRQQALLSRVGYE